MKRIGIYFFCVIALGCVTSSILYRKVENKNEMRLEKSASEEAATEEFEGLEEINTSEQMKKSVEVSDVYPSDKRFLVKEEDGYLVIYDRVSMRRYDETTIHIQELPELLQQQIADGLYFTDEEELYSFLENYSS